MPASSAPRSPPPSDLERVLAYHSATMHYPGRYASGPGFMDWDSQPDPFLRYDGALQVPLALPVNDGSVPYERSFVEGWSAPRALDHAGLSQLFADALGLSAWKQAGEARWALRVNPSSGNLHPTEGYVLAGPIEGLSEEAGLWHYRPYEHALERRRVLPSGLWARLLESQGLDEDAVLVGLSGIPLRESWKYGERAYRYCQHDCGHAIAGVAVAAAGLGWRTRLLEGWADEDLAALLGLDGSSGPEAQHPEALMAVGARVVDARAGLSAELRQAIGALPLEGRARALAEEHRVWPIIEAAAQASGRAQTPADFWGPRAALPPLTVGDAPLSLRTIIHQRRSAVDMDGRTGITADAFFQVLRKLLPGPDQVPFASLPWRPLVHLLLWVHRVEGLPPGLYLLLRDPAQIELLRGAMDPAFVWEQRGELPLYLLKEGDGRAAAAGASCGQGIASDGCFAVAMLAEYRGPLERWGAWVWRRLHWEAGAIGQMLYLEAEASGVRGTGIGCFFDEVTHRYAGIRDDALRVVYHFAVGGAVEDERLETLPAYGHRL